MKLDAYTMKRLGFKEKWPGGNPTEPWWERGDFTFMGAPTMTEFWDAVEDKYESACKEKLKDKVHDLLDEINWFF